jgi:hypothetical protein
LLVAGPMSVVVLPDPDRPKQCEVGFTIRTGDDWYSRARIQRLDYACQKFGPEHSVGEVNERQS